MFAKFIKTRRTYVRLRLNKFTEHAQYTNFDLFYKIRIILIGRAKCKNKSSLEPKEVKKDENVKKICRKRKTS